MADDPGSRPSMQLPAVFTAGAGAVHLAAAVPHFADSVLLGSGFVGVGWAQLVVAVLLVRRTRDLPVRWSAVALNAVAVAVWALSRTVGLPFGHLGPEAAGLGDTLTVALETLAVGLLVWRSRRAPGSSADRRHVAVLVAAWTLVVGSSTLAIADVGRHGHHEGAGTGQGQHANGDGNDRVTTSRPSMSSATDPATGVMADDVVPRFRPGADMEGPSNDPDPATDDHGAAHAHVSGEDH